MVFGIYDSDPKYRKYLSAILNHYMSKRKIELTINEYSSEDSVLNADLMSITAFFVVADSRNIDCLKIADHIKKSNRKIFLVLISNTLQNVLIGYEVGAFRYLLENDLQTSLARCIGHILDCLRKDHNLLSIQTSNGERGLVIQDIVYFESFKHLVVLHLSNGEAVTCHERLFYFEEKLEENGFLRIQKSYLVNMAHIEKINRYYAFLDNGMELKCSEKNYHSIQTIFSKWLHKDESG